MSVSPASSSSGRFTHLSVLTVTVLVFGAAVVAITWQLRAGLREQILRGQAETLASVSTMQLDNVGEGIPGELFYAVLKISKFPGVAGVGVYDSNRRLQERWPPLSTSDVPPLASIWDRVTAGEPVGVLHARLTSEQSADLLLAFPGSSMVEAWVPLRRSRSPSLLGAAQFWLDGKDIAADFSQHDRRLWIQAAIAWLVGSAVIVTALGWAFRRIERANRQLRLRSEDLQRANRELVLAAKTSALGAVTAHLMHELKNPLAGLEVIVAGQAEAGQRGDGGGELAAASELTRRLRSMVNDVVGVLRDEQSGADFELTCADIAEILGEKLKADAAQRGVTLEVAGTPDVTLPGRQANLATLVLRNLVQNALEATPRGRTVKLVGRSATEGAAEFLVEDAGEGLPETVRSRLFQPCASTKPGGSGLGLALSYQLAQQAGGKLELVHSGDRGTCFRLVLRSEA